MTNKESTAQITHYIAQFPPELQQILNKMHRTIHELIPEATETISYGVPTFKLQGKNVMHFGGFKDHVSIYPVPQDAALQKQIRSYQAGKGTLRFPLDQPIPYPFIAKVTKALLQEHQERMNKA